MLDLQKIDTILGRTKYNLKPYNIDFEYNISAYQIELKVKSLVPASFTYNNQHTYTSFSRVLTRTQLSTPQLTEGINRLIETLMEFIVSQREGDIKTNG